MKIVYGITKSNFGGAQRYVFDLAKGAQTEGHEVLILCGEGGVLVDKLHKENIRIIEIPGFNRDIDLLRDAPRLLFIMKIIWRERPDIFHINSAKMGGAGIFTVRILNLYSKLTAKSYKLQTIFTAHGWAFNAPRPTWQKVLIKFFSWLTVLGAHKTICVSEKIKKDIESWPFIKNKLIVIRNGLENFELLNRDSVRNSLGIYESDQLVVGTIAELHRVKGLDVLLEAWSKFKKNRNTKLIIIGEGEERRNLENMAQKLDISDSVVFKGFMENARSLLSGFDIFVLPSRSEAMPYAPLEAGLAGLPVITTRVGGIPEIIETGINGILIDPNDSEALLSTLILLSDDEVLRKRLGGALKETVEKDFEIETMRKKTFKLYEQV